MAQRMAHMLMAPGHVSQDYSRRMAPTSCSPVQQSLQGWTRCWPSPRASRSLAPSQRLHLPQAQRRFSASRPCASGSSLRGATSSLQVTWALPLQAELTEPQRKPRKTPQPSVCWSCPSSNWPAPRHPRGPRPSSGPRASSSIAAGPSSASSATPFLRTDPRRWRPTPAQRPRPCPCPGRTRQRHRRGYASQHWRRSVRASRVSRTPLPLDS